MTEGESYNILLLILTGNNKFGISPSVTQSVPPPSSEGGKGWGKVPSEMKLLRSEAAYGYEVALRQRSGAGMK